MIIYTWSFTHDNDMDNFHKQKNKNKAKPNCYVLNSLKRLMVDVLKKKKCQLEDKNLKCLPMNWQKFIDSNMMGMSFDCSLLILNNA